MCVCVCVCVCLGAAQNSPCRDFVTRWNGGACPPAWFGPWLPIGVLWVTITGSWVCRAWPSGVCVDPRVQELKSLRVVV